ncbi:hypothetical protein A2533_03870 [Candidatus Falkowbacteria bacterium RIFOXYD2_FULL_35_9]|uniref:Uncharacterized protein n=1 Tax=Candidatus Falkowbacteria bacterium RIFOXYC2_FULL_36_12 TaxID=1798002 RepID=A0A1F5T331_9BACT|nr:MAG: hypothetical protein A2300_01260 [Candidatus Falkowbacteria bacterium RIFOXYB2_FULL_35_7]OGF33312.1 MAG: hypothetical protein A2478_01240 [Candidatus Falkowbacteria bacterium RIFOXYC2_FULL_36_12]OGF34862.1 MAG: hypothetical protein A2223_00375 [Candidatus Falkowbacteria bacterium RIFOXYA2_FULL_35_8]OGF48566.1 MAG: hypothetical protein A2533_03870 [Candidatus Falkowbacteria bacterium RIFOXYD2_FULL_35_9]
MELESQMLNLPPEGPSKQLKQEQPNNVTELETGELAGVMSRVNKFWDTPFETTTTEEINQTVDNFLTELKPLRTRIDDKVKLYEFQLKDLPVTSKQIKEVNEGIKDRLEMVREVQSKFDTLLVKLEAVRKENNLLKKDDLLDEVKNLWEKFYSETVVEV